MTQIPSQGPVVGAKPQPTIYTLMLIIAILALAMTLVLVIRNLIAEPPAGYGLTFGQLFKPLKDLIPGR